MRKKYVSHLSDNIDTEIQPLQVGHSQEGARLDLLDEVSAQVQILQRAQRLQVHISNRLKNKVSIIWSPWVQHTAW